MELLLLEGVLSIEFRDFEDIEYAKSDWDGVDKVLQHSQEYWELEVAPLKHSHLGPPI